jgi:hypothetical protein
MAPTIREGERITCRPVTPGQVRRGDILLYRLPRGVIAHRVVDIQAGESSLTFRLRGDACDSEDHPVDATQVLGVVVSVERRGREVPLRGALPRALQALRRVAARLRTRHRAGSAAA